MRPGGRLCVLLGFACAFAVLAVLALGAACVDRPRMCSAPGECGPGAGCVAGRCLPDGGIPAIQNARRVLVAPVDVAYLRRSGAADDPRAPPDVFTLGRAKDGDAILFLRFSVPLAKEANVLEAYLVLERTTAIDVDPTPIVLHALRVIDPWDSRALTWAGQPRVEDRRAPATTVFPTGRTLVRLDVRDMVNHWKLHEHADQGVAVIAENSSATGMPFAMTVSADVPVSAGDLGVAAPSDQRGAAPALGNAAQAQSDSWRSGPRLELYVK